MTLDLLDRATCIDHMSAIIDTLADAVALKEADGWATWAVSIRFLFNAQADLKTDLLHFQIKKDNATLLPLDITGKLLAHPLTTI